MDTKILREEFATLHQQSGDLLTLAANDKRDLTAEEKESNTKRFARMDIIKQQVDDAKKLAEFSLSNGEAELPKTPAGKAEFDSERTGKVEFNKDAYRAAVNLFARTGDASKVAQFTVTSSTASGVFIPREVVPPTDIRRLPNAIRLLLASYGVTPITRTLTESISIPVQDDTAAFGQVQPEAATSGTVTDANYTSSLTLMPTLYSSKQQWLSNTTVNAVDFDIFAYLLPMLQRRLDKTQESIWVTSLKTNATVGKTTASPTAITYQELLAWEHSLSAAYRSDAAFLVSDSTYQTIRGLVDNNNRPVIDLDPANDFQTTLHGKPIIVSDYFDSIAASKVIGAFASAGALFVFDAGVKRIARYTLQPNFPDQTGFELFQNGDFGFVGAGVRTLATHA